MASYRMIPVPDTLVDEVIGYIDEQSSYVEDDWAKECERALIEKLVDAKKLAPLTSQPAGEVITREQFITIAKLLLRVANGGHFDAGDAYDAWKIICAERDKDSSYAPAWAEYMLCALSDEADE